MDQLQDSLPVTVNGEHQSITPGTTVAELLATLALGHQRIAVEINEELVPRSQFARHELAAGDRVEIVRAIGGG